MGTFNPSYYSTINNIAAAFSDRTALSLPDLKKDIITAFHAMTQFFPRAMVRPTDTFAARFPASWKTTASYHVPGTRLLGQTNPPARNFRDITIDDRMVVDLFVDELDAKVRTIVPFQGMFAMEMGQAISQMDDQNCAIIAALASRASATVVGADAGSQIIKTSCDVNIGALNAAIWDLKNSFDEKNVSPMGRVLGLRPAQFNLLATALDRMFYRELGQGGSIGAPVAIPSYAGFSEIFMSNNIPNTNIAVSPAGTRNTYAGDFTNTVALGFGPQAFGTVLTTASLSQGGASQASPTTVETMNANMFQPLDVREVVIPEAYGTLYLASLITGHGILNPIPAGEIRKA
jgi:hypothetical protein